jgi:hypothetical protein
MSQRQIGPWLSDVLTTTNATPTISAAGSLTVPSGAGGFVTASAVARSAAGKSGYATVGRSFHNIGGVLTLNGSLITIVSGALGVLLGDVTLATAIIDFTSSGVIVQPRVTGIAATTIEWFIDVRYWVH